MWFKIKEVRPAILDFTDFYFHLIWALTVYNKRHVEKWGENVSTWTSYLPPNVHANLISAESKRFHQTRPKVEAGWTCAWNATLIQLNYTRIEDQLYFIQSSSYCLLQRERFQYDWRGSNDIVHLDLQGSDTVYSTSILTWRSKSDERIIIYIH